VSNGFPPPRRRPPSPHRAHPARYFPV